MQPIEIIRHDAAWHARREGGQALEQAVARNDTDALRAWWLADSEGRFDDYQYYEAAANGEADRAVLVLARRRLAARRDRLPLGNGYCQLLAETREQILAELIDMGEGMDGCTCATCGRREGDNGQDR